jgi:hypothetical protein
MIDDFLRYYDLETYLFVDVANKFKEHGKLDAFDLFSIIIWKAERAKSKLAKRLVTKCGNLELAAEQFTTALFRPNSPLQRLIIARDAWGFYLPMASAILSVLWPEDFTVFDYRACEQLVSLGEADFSRIDNISSTVRLWPKYEEYREAVKRAVPQYATLRDKDRFLWGRSAARQLDADISSGFSKDLK